LVREFRRINSGRVKFTEGFIFGKAFQYPESLNSEIETRRIAKTIHNGVVDKNYKVFSISSPYIYGFLWYFQLHQ
jgi:hypothetical protein